MVFDARKWRIDNAEYLRAYNQKWRAENAEYCRTREKEWRAKNAEHVREYDKIKRDLVKKRTRSMAWLEKNREYVREQHRARYRRNKIKHNSYSRSRRIRKTQAMPAWADKKAIEAVYAEAQQLTAQTGVKYHVDHIVPLKHPKVCGLHVEHNLRAIPALDNMKKRNYFQVEV